VNDVLQQIEVTSRKHGFEEVTETNSTRGARPGSRLFFASSITCGISNAMPRPFRVRAQDSRQQNTASARDVDDGLRRMRIASARTAPRFGAGDFVHQAVEQLCRTGILSEQSHVCLPYNLSNAVSPSRCSA
jgi:hypothetical protein